MPLKKSYNPTELFQKFVPPTAVSLCAFLFDQYKFHLKVTKPRASKLGDYYYNPSTETHHISINGNLPPNGFLITYLHEVAHLIVQESFGRSVQAHGTEWKDVFRKLLHKGLEQNAFHLSLAPYVKKYALNPLYSTYSDPDLARALRKLENSLENSLSEIEEGHEFIFRDIVYRKIQKQRTRSICLNLQNKKKYIIHESAEVTPFQKEE